MSFSEARQYLANTVADWQGLRLADLQFWHRGDGRLFVLGLVFLAVFVAIARSFLVRQPGRHRLVVPAILSTLRPSYLGFVRHLPLLLFLAGVPFIACRSRCTDPSSTPTLPESTARGGSARQDSSFTSFQRQLSSMASRRSPLRGRTCTSATPSGRSSTR